MLFSTIGQVYVFLWMIGAGMLVGAAYSLTEALRRILEAGFWLTLLADVLFGLCAGLILIAALVAGSYGQFRLYELFGVLVGLLLFHAGIHPLLSRLCRRFCETLRHIFVRIRNYRLIKVIFK